MVQPHRGNFNKNESHLKESQRPKETFSRGPLKALTSFLSSKSPFKPKKQHPEKHPIEKKTKHLQAKTQKQNIPKGLGSSPRSPRSPSQRSSPSDSCSNISSCTQLVKPAKASHRLQPTAGQRQPAEFMKYSPFRKVF